MDRKTVFIKKEEVRGKKQWYLFDASGKTLGRFASEIVKVLRGKHKSSFTPNVDMGDGVIIVNAEKIKVSGMKEARKNYCYHTGAIGGLREISYRTMLDRKPEYILFHAVKGMMPKGKLGKQQMKKLRVFRGQDHGMDAQKPVSVNI